MSDNMKIKQLFEQANLTLVEQAQGIGISKSHLHNIINDKCDITMSVAQKIASYYGVLLDDLVQSDDIPNDMKLLYYLNERSGAMIWQQLTAQQRQILHTWVQDDYDKVDSDE